MRFCVSGIMPYCLPQVPDVLVQGQGQFLSCAWCLNKYSWKGVQRDFKTGNLIPLPQHGRSRVAELLTGHSELKICILRGLSGSYRVKLRFMLKSQNRTFLLSVGEGMH